MSVDNEQSTSGYNNLFFKRQQELNKYRNLATEAIDDSKFFRRQSSGLRGLKVPMIEGLSVVFERLMATHRGNLRMMDWDRILYPRRGDLEDRELMSNAYFVRDILLQLVEERGMREGSVTRAFNGVVNSSLLALQSGLFSTREYKRMRKRKGVGDVTPGRTFHTNEVGPPNTIMTTLKRRSF